MWGQGRGRGTLRVAIVAGILLAVFFLLDTWFQRREQRYAPETDPTPPRPFRICGLVNLVLIGAVIGAILSSRRCR